MKKIILISMILCAGKFCFAKDINSPEVVINETLTVTFKSINDPVNTVRYNNQTYGPKDTKANTMAEVVFKVTNTGTETLKNFTQLKNIELVCADKNGILSFSSWDILFEEEYKAGATQTEFNKNFFHIEEYNIEPQSTFEKTVYFVHPKKLTPVAFTQNRKVVCTFYDEKSRNATVIAKNLLKTEKIPECFELVNKASIEEILRFMNEYGITFADEDKSGKTLLYCAIVYNNNDFLDVAINQHADTKHTIAYITPYVKLTPMQYAVLCGNGYAVDKLITAGEDLFFQDPMNGIADIGSTVVQQNNILGAKILVEHGYNFSALSIGGWSKKETAVEYAESNKYVELAEYLKSVIK